MGDWRETLETTEATRHILARAAVRLGGVDALASRLKISQRALTLYIQGHEAAPDSLLLRAIDFILDDLPERAGEAPRSLFGR